MYNGETFREQEYLAWVTTEPKGAELNLKVNDANKSRNRILHYVRKHDNTIETTKVTDTILKLKLIWI